MEEFDYLENCDFPVLCGGISCMCLFVFIRFLGGFVLWAWCGVGYVGLRELE